MSDYKKPVRFIAAYEAVVKIHLDEFKRRMQYADLDYTAQRDINTRVEVIETVAAGYDAYIVLYDKFRELMADESLESDVVDMLSSHFADDTGDED